MQFSKIVVALLLLMVQLAAAQDAYLTLDNLVWNHQYRGTDKVNMNSFCRDLVGNYYGVGYTVGNFGGHNTLGAGAAFVMKFAPSGARVWIRFLDTPWSEEATHCATDSAGGVVVSGNTKGNLDTTGGSRTYDNNLAEGFVSRFDASGALLWTKIIHPADNSGSGSYDVSANSVKVDADNNIYFVANFYPYNTYAASVYVMKLNADGDKLYETRVSNGNSYIHYEDVGNGPRYTSTNTYFNSYPFNGEQHADIMDCNSFGDCYVAFNGGSSNVATVGTTGFKGGSTDIFLVRLDSNGTKVWTAGLGSSGKDYVNAVKLDAFGNPWVAGGSNAAVNGETHFGASDSVVYKYTPEGQLLFTRQFGSRQDQNIMSMDADAQGTMFLVTQQLNSQSNIANTNNFDGINVVFQNENYAVVTMMDSFGNRVFSKPIRSGFQSGFNRNYMSVWPQSIRVSPDGTRVLVAGKFTGLLNEPSLPAGANYQIASGFVMAADVSQTCNSQDFDGVMTEINDLLVTMGI